ncbi:MAG: YraN family protein [Dysgonamonadaceae bacterium]|jgi:putative endonuclease|nr:YraN family protein [Dysgonamonadaceae bacterium]
MAQHNDLGKSGEAAALNYLQTHGYRIRHTNWRRGYVELDIVAETDDELVIVEVKTRNGHWEAPEDAVTNAKIKHIISATDAYIKYFDVDLPARFDIISVTGNEPNFEIEHIEDAFYPPVQTYRR